MSWAVNLGLTQSCVAAGELGGVSGTAINSDQRRRPRGNDLNHVDDDVIASDFRREWSCGYISAGDAICCWCCCKWWGGGCWRIADDWLRSSPTTELCLSTEFDGCCRWLPVKPPSTGTTPLSALHDGLCWIAVATEAAGSAIGCRPTPCRSALPLLTSLATDLVVTDPPMLPSRRSRLVECPAEVTCTRWPLIIPAAPTLLCSSRLVVPDPEVDVEVAATHDLRRFPGGKKLISGQRVSLSGQNSRSASFPLFVTQRWSFPGGKVARTATASNDVTSSTVSEPACSTVLSAASVAHAGEELKTRCWRGPLAAEMKWTAWSRGWALDTTLTSWPSPDDSRSTTVDLVVITEWKNCFGLVAMSRGDLDVEEGIAAQSTLNNTVKYTGWSRRHSVYICISYRRHAGGIVFCRSLTS